MKNIQIILFLTLFSILTYAADLADNRLLLVLNTDQPALQFKNNKAINISQNMQKMFETYQVQNIQPWLRSANASDIYGAIDFSKVYRINFDRSYPKQELMKIRNEFNQLPEVSFTENEEVFKIDTPVLSYAPTDPMFSNQWYLSRIKADFAWGIWQDALPGDRNMLVGVVDTGIDYLHPDLAKVMYINPGEDIDGDGLFTEADINNIDDDGNGFVDDLRGWDFSEAYDEFSGDNDIRPPYPGSNSILSHGTHVAGIMAAETDNDLGISGIAFQAKIIATKQSQDDDLSNGYLYNAYDGILYCAKMGAEIINCSWGGTHYSELAEDLINHVVDTYGSIVVCAAGNDNVNNDYNHHYPSDYDNTIAVVALNASDQKASFSNYGEVIDISAPGTGILSTIHVSSGGYASWQGTSMASPVVAGAFALLRSRFPEKDRQWLIDEIYETAENLDEKNSRYVNKLGAGRVNIYNAIASKYFPNIEINNFAVQTSQDSTIKQLLPGDQAEIKFVVENTTGWLDAADISVKISSESDFLSFPDSLLQIDYLTAGTSDSLIDKQLSIQIAEDAFYQAYPITIEVTANQDSLYKYTETYEQEITVTDFYPNYPKTEWTSNQPLTAAPIGPDSSTALIQVTINNQLVVFDKNGAVYSGFPVDLNYFTDMPPLVADFSGDSHNDIAIANRNGLLQVFDHCGTRIFTYDVGSPIYGTASAADFNNDNIPEVVFGSMDKKLHIIQADSSELPGFPIAINSFINLGIALADFDDDNVPELLYGTYDGNVHLITASGQSLNSNWPLQTNGRLTYTPLIVKGDHSLKIILVNTNNQLEIYDQAGQLKLQLQLDEAVCAQPALADLNNDDFPEIIFPTENELLHIIDLQGADVGASPFSLNGVMRTSAVVAKDSVTNKSYILAATETGALYMMDAQGAFRAHYPAKIDAKFSSSPVFLNFDKNDSTVFAIGGATGLFMFNSNLKSDLKNCWTTELGNNLRTGSYQTDAVLSVESEEMKVVSDYNLYQNFPNPFNDQTLIKYHINNQLSGKQKVQLELYNVAGQKIKTLFSGKQTPGIYQLKFNATGLSSGVYFYKLVTDDFVQSKKMIYLK